MVFEAVVVELLNKFLKQYIENLDTSQLKIGIWGGDVVLNDLKIKSRIFEDLNLPVRVKWGKLEKLALKIPWKNLYSSQVVVEIKGLLLVVVPNVEFHYDAVKEEKWAQEKKKARLRAIEEAKKQELEQGPKKQQSDGFVEKLVTQITKNLQIIIKDIHIRYEDKSTIPESPFSAGITLSTLSALTTLSDPTKNFSKLMQENEHFICKVVNLEGLAVYWNSNSALFSHLPEDDLVSVMVKSIPKVEYKPKGFMYLFGPLSASAFLRLNPKPELDGSNYTIPKVFVNVNLKEIELAVTHHQFSDAMLYLQDFHRFLAANKYRKFRPVGISVIGHAREWWHFAYTAILEDILRRKREWSWENILEHRKTCRRYAELFKQKCSGKKMSPDDAKSLELLEKKLNVFNLVLIREQVHVEVARTEKEQKSGGWFSGWFGYGAESKAESNGDELVKKIQSVMTTQEKQKLYKAIGYEENDSPTSYPVTFVQLQFWFHLDEIKATVYDDRKNELATIMTLSVKSVKMEFERRPAAFATKFVMILGNFHVKGKREIDGSYPDLIISNCKESESLMEVLFEEKPLNATCDQRIIVNARPLSIIYHAMTINLVRDVFKTDSPEEVEKIVAATSASLPTFQKITLLGLQYAIEKQTVIEVKVNIMSSNLIIPYEGAYHRNKDMLVLVLGSLNIETEESNKKNVSVKKLFLEGTTNEEIFSTVLSASYTNFKCSLTGLQVLFQLSGEDWVEASKEQRSPLQFLKPTNVEVVIKKSLVVDDARIPKIIIEGKMPSLAFHLEENRFISFVALAFSIPTKTEKSGPRAISISSWSVHSLSTQLENTLINMQKDFRPQTSTEYTQGIDFVGHFEINELTVSVSKLKPVEDGPEKEPRSSMGLKFLNLRIISLETHITSKTFEVIHLLKLGGIDFKQYHNKNWFSFVSTKVGHDYLFVVEFIKLSSKIPDFYTARDGILNRLTLNVTPLNILLEKEALLAQLAFVTNIRKRVECVKDNALGGRLVDSGKPREEAFDSSIDHFHDKKVITKGKRFRRKAAQKEVIDFFLQASLDEIDVVIENSGSGLAEFSLKGGSVDISTQKSYTTVDVNLRELCLLDLNELTKHSKILWSLDKHTVLARVTMFNKEFFGRDHSLDMSIDAEIGGVQCTCVTLFFNRAFEYLSAFQSQMQTLMEGVSIAAEKAKENMMKAFQNAAEISLKVKITAPIFIVPTTSVSLETVHIDLGVLTVKNSITELDYIPEGGPGRRPLIDTLSVLLQRLKISRCLLNEETMAVEYEKDVIIPVTFDLNVKRNLSRGWFRVIPELEILARLASVRVTLTHEDLSAILNILQKNIEEGEQAKPQSNVSSVRKQADQKPSVKMKDQRLFSHHQIVEEPASGTEPAKYYTVVKFTFFMESFVFDAINSIPNSNEDGTGLARFVLETISLKGRLFSDNSIHTSIVLESCVLDDMRPGKEGRLTRLMERSVETVASSKEDGSHSNSMIEIIYQKNEHDCFLDIRVFKFTLILSMDFLQKLGVFFTLDNTSSSENMKTSVKTADKIVLSAAENSPVPTLTVNIRLEKPDIIIVKNIDSVDTDALIFHTEMVVQYRLANVKQIISGTLKDIELYSCCFNPAKRPHTMNQVIKPFTVSIAGSTPENSGLHVDICFTEISISINPATVDLITKCHEALLKETSSRKSDEEEESFLDLWDVKPFNVDDYWFFRVEEGEDALSTLRSQISFSDSESPCSDQICLLAIPSIRILLEGLSGRAQPLISIDMSFQMRCYNWSQRMTIMSSLTLQMQYYNHIVSYWEPLIEPVEKHGNQNLESLYIPWELNCSIIHEDEGELEGVRPPKVQITLSSSEILQLTISKTGLDVLKTTVEIFTTAVTKHVVKKPPDLPPYVVKNETGYPIELLLEESKLQVCKSLSNSYNIVKLDVNSEVALMNVVLMPSEVNRNISLSELKKETRLYMKLSAAGNEVFVLALGQNSTLYHTFQHSESSKEVTWSFVSEVSIQDNSTTVVLRSILTITNYFEDPVNIHSLSKNKTVAEYVGSVEGNSSFNLPLQTVFSQNTKLFFSVNGYSLSVEPFDWALLKQDPEVSRLLQCTSKLPENEDPFFIQVVGEATRVKNAKTLRKTAASTIYKIRLQPTLKILNSLPFTLVICFQGSSKERSLQPGNSLQVTNAEPGSSTLTVRIPDYLEKEWSCKQTIPQNPSDFFIWKFVTYNGLSPESLNLGVHVTRKNLTFMYTIYCPYFMVNKTGHLLSYKFEHTSTVFFHPGDMKLPVMFSPSSKKFFSKKSATVQVNQSSWSEPFPVDVAGSGGTVECKHHTSNLTYKISVTISLTYNSLTKVIVFTPYYVLINSMEYTIECREAGCRGQKWLEIPPLSYTPFWPKVPKNDKTIYVKPKDSVAITPAFAYHCTDTCLLRLPHKWGGIFVSVKVTQSGIYITFSSYEVGQAPVLIMNHSPSLITVNETNTEFSVTLKSFEQVLHTWVAPTGDRTLNVTAQGNENNVIPLDGDCEGVFYTGDDIRIRYVTFLDGTQRVLLFTFDEGLSKSISGMKLSSSGVEFISKIQGIGVSVVNDVSRIEIMYLTFISSGITWEVRKKGKTVFKQMKDSEANHLEIAYGKYLDDAEENIDVDPVVSVTDKIKVNFETMELLQPVPKELKRTAEPGFWLAYRQIEEQIMLHVKINRIQVDNQLVECIFPVVLAPVPPPKSVVYHSPKPFFELSVVKIATSRSGVQQYKYFKTLIQEFHVKLDIAFIQHLNMFLSASEMTDEQEKAHFRKDLEFIEQPLQSHVEVVASNEQKHFYDLLHFSPLKIHFSFSLGGKLETNSNLPHSFSVMLQSLGVTLTDVDDVIFRLSFFERRSVFLTKKDVMNELISHYYSQIISQAYVLLLGLDLIGNPYGLIVGIGEGVEAFFYEPFQGIIQGPSEFGKGMAIGWKRMFGHTVGSAAGTLGKLTGTLGKGLAVLSLDKDYQMQRMMDQGQHGNIQSSMARGGRGLVMGVLEGVSGVVSKPIEGAKQEGVGGFFKGMGKGMMGLVTRPVTGIVDFASTSLNAVKRATLFSADLKRMRPPRYFRSDSILEPYNLRDAQGNLVLCLICRRKYYTSDKYQYHLYLKDKEIVLLTNKRIIMAEFSEVFGSWQEHMSITWKSMPDRPRCHTKGVALTMPPRQGVSKKEVKVLLVDDKSVQEVLCKKMIELYQLEKLNDEES